jgi:hypothetical protein
MAKIKLDDPKYYTVICHWQPDGDACQPWHTVAVGVKAIGGAQNAANEACLYLIWDRQGQAQAWLVIEGHHELYAPDNGVFDAQEYDEVITFGVEILYDGTLADRKWLSESADFRKF